MKVALDEVRWLLIDSCGPVATLAVGRGSEPLAQTALAGRALSADWPEALRGLLRQSGMQPADLHVVGVLNGPGSFTGVRVGLALAKGLCESLGLKLVVLSRLALLQGELQGNEQATALIDAGRGEWYMRQGGDESVVDAAKVSALGDTSAVSLPEDEAALRALGVPVTTVALSAVAGLPPLLQRWQQGTFADLATADANYVRDARSLYATGLRR